MFPFEFEKNMRALLGVQYADFEQSMCENPPVSIRTNNKTQIDFIANAENVKWCKSGFYLAERPQFTLDVLFHAGAYYVQEASSMFLEQIVNQYFNEVKTVLDLCASPGGKSTLLLNVIKNDTLLISNELIRSRANILNENITKWGNENVVVTNNKPSDFKQLTEFFDAILVDAPCSGEGMFRKDAQAVAEWSPAAVKMCAARQKEILAEIWDTLKTDGILIYSTCTFNRAENEENTQWIAKNLGAEILKINISDFPEITETDCGYRFYPHKTKGEGFYISILKKKIKTSKNTFRITQSKKNFIKTEKIPLFGKMIGIEENNFIKYYNSNFYNEFIFFDKNFKTLKSGLTLGERKGKNIVPSHELAMSKIIDIKQFNTIEVDYQTAMKFLRKENIFLENKNSDYFLLLFKNTPTGWIKNLGNRCNNLYINEWRIRMK
jgi:16S rRNA C967 or C1407 C5-methylase (RsmB/RsmF family)/NOL1/NOP2/fmu family ribosome biogenesis protein